MVSPTRCLAGWLAHDAPVDPAAPRSLSIFDHALGAIHRRAFLVAGDQEGDGALVVAGIRATKASAAVSMAARPLFMSAAPRPNSRPSRDGGLERLGAPFLQGAGGHHIGVAGEAQHRRAAAVGGPEILDAAEIQQLVAETRPRRAGPSSAAGSRDPQGVTEGRAMRSCVSCRVSGICNVGNPRWG